MSMDPRLLTVPGYTGSGPEHWQSRWEEELDSCHRVEQEEWDRPSRNRWVGALADAVVESGPGLGRWREGLKLLERRSEAWTRKSLTEDGEVG